jgi:AhpD family alkylhydroperoxidase
MPANRSLESGMKLPHSVQDKVIDVGALILRTGAVENKEKALVALSCAMATSCAHCHGEFVALARKLGATQSEIDEVEAIAERVRQRCENETGLYRLN